MTSVKRYIPLHRFEEAITLIRPSTTIRWLLPMNRVVDLTDSPRQSKTKSVCWPESNFPEEVAQRLLLVSFCGFILCIFIIFNMNINYNILAQLAHYVSASMPARRIAAWTTHFLRSRSSTARCDGLAKKANRPHWKSRLTLHGQTPSIITVSHTPTWAGKSTSSTAIGAVAMRKL